MTQLPLAGEPPRPNVWHMYRAMVGVGLTARRATRSWPVVNPPVRPPLLLPLKIVSLRGWLDAP